MEQLNKVIGDYPDPRNLGEIPANDEPHITLRQVSSRRDLHKSGFMGFNDILRKKGNPVARAGSCRLSCLAACAK